MYAYNKAPKPKILCLVKRHMPIDKAQSPKNGALVNRHMPMIKPQTQTMGPRGGYCYRV
jgi:hypothetical protein